MFSMFMLTADAGGLARFPKHYLQLLWVHCVDICSSALKEHLFDVPAFCFLWGRPLFFI